MGDILYIEDAYEKHRAPQRRRKKAGSVRWILILLFWLVSALAGYFFAQSPVFYINEITVTGNNRVSLDEVYLLSRVEKGQHIYRFRTDYAEVMLRTNHIVEDVTVKRHLPDKIEIIIKERTPAAAVPTQGGVALVDLYGVVIDKTEILDGLSLMTIVGASDLPEIILPSETLDSDKLRSGLGVIERMSKEAASVISEIDVSEPQRLVARTIYKVDCRLGDEKNFTEKFNVFMEILRDEEAEGRLSRLKYIDVAIPTMPLVAYNDVDNVKKPAEEIPQGPAGKPTEEGAE